ncbi:coronin-1C-like isoform X3 [Culicoides brevitarsis]|uniref:coronin-1C-like isoform X3 n=1 Tax=Culicoides brevitarsis TaxID=469753 RepID=UPI00307C7FC2
MTNSQVWFRGIRPSKFRHVYGVPSKKEACYTDISMVRSGNDGNLCAVNPKFLAIVSESAFVVIPMNLTGRIDFQCCKVIGHNGAVTDLKWNPFNDNMIASGSDDCTIRIWSIPEGGLTSNLTESVVELTGHKRKILHIEWHPTASDVIISAGFDHLIIVWDISNSNQNAILNVINCHSDMIYCLAINRDGSLIATTSKDKQLRIIEPRSGIVVSEAQAHEGTKCSKVVFLENNRVLTTGFSRHSGRQYALWNQHDLKKPLIREEIDNSSGILIPYYDPDTHMLYLAGKGDGNIRYYEVVDEAPYIYYLSQFLSGHPQKALGVLPKRGVNVAQCEVFRFYKLHATGNICEPISMIVPRKSTLFQADLYPDTLAPEAALTAKEWFHTKRNAQPTLMSMHTGHTTLDIENKTLYKETNIIRKPSMRKSMVISTTEIEENHVKDNKENEKNVILRTIDNTSKKFEFLSRSTTIDYRPQQITDKNQKTTTNQSTKFHQLQAIFGEKQPVNGITQNTKDINNLQNNLLSNVEKNNSRNSSLENLNQMNSENELRKAYMKQSDEVKSLRKLLNCSEKRIKELESEVRRLQIAAARK